MNSDLFRFICSCIIQLISIIFIIGLSVCIILVMYACVDMLYQYIKEYRHLNNSASIKKEAKKKQKLNE